MSAASPRRPRSLRPQQKTKHHAQETPPAHFPMAAPVSKKRRTSASPAPTASSQQGRAYTLSIAVPSTLLATAPNPILKTHLAGHLARISALHNVDEIVLYNPAPPTTTPNEDEENEQDQLPHILAYLATAPYLRKRLFPPHRHLRHVGLLPPLSLSTHPRPGAPAPFRPALAIPAPTPTPAGTVTLDAGLPAPVVVAADVAVGATVLLRMAGAAEVVARHTPREEHGMYSGYEVRRAAGLAAVFTECGWEGGYDLSVGVACGDGGGGGVALDDAVGGGAVPAFRHLLVAVGDLEGAARADAAGLAGVVGGARELFDLWVDPVAGCGCGGVSAEEALFAALAGLRRVVVEKGVR